MKYYHATPKANVHKILIEGLKLSGRRQGWSTGMSGGWVLRGKIFLFSDPVIAEEKVWDAIEVAQQYSEPLSKNWTILEISLPGQIEVSEGVGYSEDEVPVASYFVTQPIPSRYIRVFKEFEV